MVDELLLPHEPAAPGIERQQRVGETIATQAHAAVEVGARRTGRDQHQAVLLVDRHHAPGVAGAGARGLCKVPLGRRRVRGRIRQRVEGPQLRAAAGVVGADDTALHVGGAVVADRGTHYHGIAVDGRRGGHQVRARIANAHTARQIDLAAIAEVVARATGFGIERQQACVQRAGEHPPPARTGLPGLAALPDTDAAGTDFGVAPGAIDARIEAPARAPGLRIECDHDVRAGLEIQETEGEHRGGFEGELAGARQPRAQLGGAIGPGDRQPGDIGAVDLIEAREALAKRITAVVAPVAGIRRLRERGAHRGDTQRRHDAQPAGEACAKRGAATRAGNTAGPHHGGHYPRCRASTASLKRARPRMLVFLPT